MSESEDIVDLTLTEDDVPEALESDDKSHPIIIGSEEESTFSDENTILIPNKLKGQYLDEAIASYKAKCKQYIEERKAEWLMNYLKR